MGPEQPGEPLRPHLLTSLGGWSNHELKVSGEAQAEHRSDEQWINGFKKKKKTHGIPQRLANSSSYSSLMYSASSSHHPDR